LDQIAKFIIANSSATTIGPTSTVPSIDPYSCTFSQSITSFSLLTNYVSASRYVPGGAATSTTTTTTTTTTSYSAASKFFPQKYPVLFDTGNFANIITKVKQVNAEMEAKEVQNPPTPINNCRSIVLT